MTLVCVNGSPAGHALRHIGRKIRAARPQAGQGRRQRRRAAGSAADLCGNASEPVSAGALGFGCAGLCARGAGGPVSAGVAGGLGCGTSGHWNSWCVVRRASISRPPLLTASGVLADVHQPSQQEHLRVRLPRSLPDALRGLGHGRLPQGVTLTSAAHVSPHIGGPLFKHPLPVKESNDALCRGKSAPFKPGSPSFQCRGKSAPFKPGRPGFHSASLRWQSLTRNPCLLQASSTYESKGPVEFL